ncbi:MAG: hypothetical protein DMF62_00890 [Acidobacteria bacterium]|nr:MAG: hypothetical protein DMF62_00890 [Acidobacteriota bacterium]
MRSLANIDKIKEFMRLFGRSGRTESRVYFTGGATAVLFGWRDSTVDVDIKFIPDSDELFRAIPAIKERLMLNVELASPPDFIPTVPGWETRSQFIEREGNVSFYHYDIYSQALSKLERAHAQDLDDVKSMIELGLIEREKLSDLFSQIEAQLHRYPAINPATFARSVQNILSER